MPTSAMPCIGPKSQICHQRIILSDFSLCILQGATQVPVAICTMLQNRFLIINDPRDRFLSTGDCPKSVSNHPKNRPLHESTATA